MSTLSKYLSFYLIQSAKVWFSCLSLSGIYTGRAFMFWEWVCHTARDHCMTQAVEDYEMIRFALRWYSSCIWPSVATTVSVSGSEPYPGKGASWAGLAIYAARGLRRGTAEITAVIFTTAVKSENEMRKLDIFQVASNVSLVAEAGCKRRARKHAETHFARVERRKLC